MVAGLLKGVAAKKFLKPGSENKNKLSKRIKSSKFISKSEDEDGSSSIVKTSEFKSDSLIKSQPSLIPKVSLLKGSEPKALMGSVGFEELNKVLDSLIQNTTVLAKISKDDLNSKLKETNQERKEKDKERKLSKEEKAESKSRKGLGKTLQISAPKIPLFDKIWDFFKGFALGTAIMSVLSIFSDPKTSKGVFDFLEKHFDLVFIGALGALGLALIAPLTPLLGAVIPLFSILSTMVGGLVALLLNPSVWPAVAAIVATGAVIAGTAAPAGQNSQISGPNAVWRDPRLPPTSRKAIIESTFDHMPYNTWPQDAKELYEQAVRDLGLSLQDEQNKLRQKVTQSPSSASPTPSSMPGLPPRAAQPGTGPAGNQVGSPVGSPQSIPQTSLVPQSSLPALPPTGVDPTHGAAQMYGAARRGGRKHAGQDFDAGPNDVFYSRIGGKVMRILYDKGYGNYVDIYNSDLNVTERIAEGDVNLVKKGQVIAPGTAVQRGTNKTGVFHYEIRKGSAETYGFDGTLDPLKFLSGQASQVQMAQSQSSAASPAPTVGQYASYESNFGMGMPSFMPIPIIQQSPSQPPVSATRAPVGEMTNMHQVLNNYYSFQVLGFLYKQG